MMIKGAIFDMDGLMIDSERIVFENWSEVMPKYGYEYDVSIFKMTVGIRRVEEQKLLKKLYGEDFPYMDIVDDCHALFVKKTQNGVPVKKGIFELLEFLKANDIKTAVATSTRRASAERCLKLAKLISYFDAFVFGEDVKNGKPDPEVFLTASKLIGVPPGNCVVLEDSINGINAAYSAGMGAIMVPDFVQPDDELKKKITLLCSDLTETIPFFERDFVL